jgi:GH25 family lysozyme M1 (1,4-beta-N-acetylmuramidase)
VSLTFVDVSVYQGHIDWPRVRANGAILRSTIGLHVDGQLAHNRAGARANPHIVTVGYYCYLKAGVDAAAQARTFASAVGPLRADEFMALDVEEGGGDQSGRANAFLATLRALHVDPKQEFVYSGLYFKRSHLGGVRIRGDHWWIAAYGPREPTDAHALWQYSNHVHFDGIGYADASIFHGTAAQWHALITPTAEDDMFDADDRRMLLNLYRGFFSGGHSMQDGGKPLERSMAEVHATSNAMAAKLDALLAAQKQTNELLTELRDKIAPHSVS